MRIALIILIFVHASIHLFGYFKAFDILEFNAITQPITKSIGILWLVAFLSLAATILLLSIQHQYWWALGILAAILSQILIIVFWKDAKFGSLINLVILISSIVAMSAFIFQQKVNTETKKMLSVAHSIEANPITEQMLVDLPLPVQGWLSSSGVIGKDKIENVFLEQDLSMLLKPEQSSSYSTTASQYFTIDPPAFNWSVSLQMNPLMSVVGRDKFEDGKGEMTMKLFSLIPVVNLKNEEKLNQASLQRYLAEIVWFPSAALSPYITWEAIDENSAKARMVYNGTEGSGVFHFDVEGNFTKFVAMRFKDAKDAEPSLWTVTATKTESKNGIKIPVEAKVDWELDGGNWTWLKLKITNITYNF